MLFELPDPSTLYQALLRRDANYDGRAFVCVSSTGVFCRLTCPARKPKAEHCRFFSTVGECMEAGYRACKRCKPLGPAAASDPIVTTLTNALDADPERRWSEDDVRELGVDPSTARRTFKRHFGMTFLAMARHRRLGRGFETIGDGARVIDAQVHAGFDSASAFRAAFAGLLGTAPGSFDAKAMLLADWIRTPLGDMIVVASRTHVHLLEFLDRAALKGELST
ncbi:MAG: bifunctional transcriptional activator/DNA repair enzyme AdaA, partial [Pseudomonadota bacterium]